MGERRVYQRHEICLSVRADTSAKPGRLGMSRNGSGSGMLFGTPSRFGIGERIRVTFRLPWVDYESAVTGTIVRIERQNNDSWCNHLIAVSFDDPDPTLDACFGWQAQNYPAN